MNELVDGQYYVEGYFLVWHEEAYEEGELHIEFFERSETEKLQDRLVELLNEEEEGSKKYESEDFILIRGERIKPYH